MGKKVIRGFNVREGMTLQAGERVEVYYNINQGGFSIRSMDKRNPNRGKVVAYSEFAYIEGATFHVSQTTLTQIRRLNRKDVYATVRGTFVHADSMDNSEHRKGYCNPYKTGKFIDWDSKEEVTQAGAVYFYEKFFSYLEKR